MGMWNTLYCFRINMVGKDNLFDKNDEREFYKLREAADNFEAQRITRKNFQSKLKSKIKGMDKLIASNLKSEIYNGFKKEIHYLDELKDAAIKYENFSSNLLKKNSRLGKKIETAKKKAIVQETEKARLITDEIYDEKAERYKDLSKRNALASSLAEYAKIKANKRREITQIPDANLNEFFESCENLLKTEE
ncbi:MAG: hypothetical protein RsTaC01_1045 [Candidatus Paraimprobicoccus trichonymphae]|uniref:Uncharacterized protein n=1 Tax=Candidatus Paraimprobicoccus trichonymphae TaxID=3033793 RepID=A0AA48L080_9FIRM|nr:MAG: hypothetical protein RsTaC01_1045 [Candidatus Paraimprobicoccus trichonymphae]